MGLCKCGRAVGGSGKRCRRCAALSELGLKAEASEASIKSAFRNQIKMWHPDRQGENTAQQLAAEEKAKRINTAYKYLTSPSKQEDVPSSRRSAGTPASSRDKSSQSTSTSASGNAPSSRTISQGAGDRQQPKDSNESRSKRSRSSRQEIPNYPQRDFTSWKSAFDKVLISGSKAADGLKKWVSHVASQRASQIVFVTTRCKELGVEPNLKDCATPEDAQADVLTTLWSGSEPNVMERTCAAKSDKQFLRRMEKLRDLVVDFVNAIQLRNAKLRTQDQGFIISLGPVCESCIQLSTSITTASAFVKRKYMQPLDLTDCCIGLVWELEEMHGLSQAECHELIKYSLLAHGCTPEQVAPFDIGSVERGTIRAKKEALAKKILDSVNVIAQIMQDIKRQNVGS